MQLDYSRTGGTGVKDELDKYDISFQREIVKSLGKNPHLSRFSIRIGDPIPDFAHILDGCRFISDADEIALRQIPHYAPEPDFLGEMPEYRGPGTVARCLGVVPIESLGVKHCFNVMEHMDGSRYSYGAGQIDVTKRFYETYLPRAVPVIQRFIDSAGDFMPIERGYVYVMESVQEGFNVVKIGKSISPDNRLKQVSPKMPFECEFKEVYPSYFMSLAEKLIHKKFAHLRTNGEWFRFAPELEEWMLAEMGSFVKFAWIAQLKESLWQLPEVRIASIFEPKLSFDPYERGWSAIKDFENFSENEWA
jgi:hypothetical protein